MTYAGFRNILGSNRSQDQKKGGNKMSSLKETMQTFAVNQALKYIEGDPGENLPKLMDMVDKFSPDDWYVEQRKAIRTAITKKTTGTSWC